VEVEKLMTQVLDLKGKSVRSDRKLICGFLGDCRLRMMTSATIKRYESILKIISNKLKDVGISLIDLDKQTLKIVLRFLMVDCGLSHKTLENYFSALSPFYDYLVYEGIIDRNIILSFRKRYLRQYKNNRGNPGPQRKLISVEEMADLITTILNPRDKAIVTLLAKTGIRRNELIQIDLDDIDWIEQSIQLKPHPKRSNCIVFFDDECAHVLKRWIRTRNNYYVKQECRALFINNRRTRLKRNGVYDIVTKYAKRVGLHNSKSEKMEDHFTPHCCRHWFTTHLRRNGMRRAFIKELRGDARREAMDIYDHIDRKELKRAYLAAIPILGIY
jgi:integrase/recombinase XerD